MWCERFWFLICMLWIKWGVRSGVCLWSGGCSCRECVLMEWGMKADELPRRRHILPTVYARTERGGAVWCERANSALHAVGWGVLGCMLMDYIAYWGGRGGREHCIAAQQPALQARTGTEGPIYVCDMLLRSGILGERGGAGGSAVHGPIKRMSGG